MDAYTDSNSHEGDDVHEVVDLDLQRGKSTSRPGALQKTESPEARTCVDGYLHLTVDLSSDLHFYRWLLDTSLVLDAASDLAEESVITGGEYQARRVAAHSGCSIRDASNRMCIIFCHKRTRTWFDQRMDRNWG